VFPVESSLTNHMPLFRRPGPLTEMIAGKLKGNPRYGMRDEPGAAAKAKGDAMMSFPNVAGAQLRKQFKAWKKTKKKKKARAGGYPVIVSKKSTGKKVKKEGKSEGG